jgi:hypothetical protein
VDESRGSEDDRGLNPDDGSIDMSKPFDVVAEELVIDDDGWSLNNVVVTIDLMGGIAWILELNKTLGRWAMLSSVDWTAFWRNSTAWIITVVVPFLSVYSLVLTVKDEEEILTYPLSCTQCTVMVKKSILLFFMGS